jgi:hypothetical protein
VARAAAHQSSRLYAPDGTCLANLNTNLAPQRIRVSAVTQRLNGSAYDLKFSQDQF